tara:strand:+ start:880 stop:1161 length:282 start_codon:yes stop_codon:yes gene_type:complete
MKLLLSLVVILVLTAFGSSAQETYSMSSPNLVGSETADDTINTSRLKQLILYDLRGLPRPSWRIQYALTITRMLANFEDHGLIVKGYVAFRRV